MISRAALFAYIIMYLLSHERPIKAHDSYCSLPMSLTNLLTFIEIIMILDYLSIYEYKIIYI